ncbi:phosphoribosylamine--glycine ligase [Belnapia sp. T6]|uniref:Phosphoribosylamine--glycine ligase n=1 Tax=Belnapia mucosa TaxID=2804532 RepID=A0ABS1V5N1_9PROT|nr:phosphoribosylamine--glycine ligase [Belnapia mucosa]MBL6457003.1 phosphoribosylamine--glycine ligase [Belnapia mucosa]
MRPRRAARLALLLPLLGACSWFGAPAPAEPETQDQRECRQEARSSPAMKALDRQRMPGNTVNDDRIAQEARVVMARAYRDCLRARGLAMPGGVERNDRAEAM